MKPIAQIKVDEIIIGKRQSGLNEEIISQLMKSINAGALINSITINQDKELISGLQRIEAYKRLNRTLIPCSVITTNDKEEKLLLEIDENLVRKKLHYIEFANQLLLQKDLYEKIYPETVHGKNKGSNSKKSFVNTKIQQLDRGQSTISKYIKIGKLDENIQKKIIELDISITNCIKLCSEKNIIKILEKLEKRPASQRDIKDFIEKKVKKENMIPQIVTPLQSTSIAQSSKLENTIPRIDLMDRINIEYYYGSSKQQGFNIVKRNNFLQYHYFSQDYKVLSTASMICLITITHNGLKEYIGFISINSPTLNKTYRNQFFGSNFFKHFYNMYKGVKLLNMSRIVMLPSYRGLGITKQLQKKITDNLFSNKIENFTDVLYIEINSVMLHNFDFIDDSFNKTFMNLRNVLTASEYIEYFTPDKNNENTPGYKEGSTLIANTAFRFNEKYLYILQEYTKKYLNVIVDDYDAKQMLKEVNNVDFRGIEKPLILENINMEVTHELAA